jgi:hypothetical protein
MQPEARRIQPKARSWCRLIGFIELFCAKRKAPEACRGGFQTRPCVALASVALATSGTAISWIAQEGAAGRPRMELIATSEGARNAALLSSGRAAQRLWRDPIEHAKQLTWCKRKGQSICLPLSFQKPVRMPLRRPLIRHGRKVLPYQEASCARIGAPTLPRSSPLVASFSARTSRGLAKRKISRPQRGPSRVASRRDSAVSFGDCWAEWRRQNDPDLVSSPAQRRFRHLAGLHVLRLRRGEALPRPLVMTRRHGRQRAT